MIPAFAERGRPRDGCSIPLEITVVIQNPQAIPKHAELAPSRPFPVPYYRHISSLTESVGYIGVRICRGARSVPLSIAVIIQDPQPIAEDANLVKAAAVPVAYHRNIARLPQKVCPVDCGPVPLAVAVVVQHPAPAADNPRLLAAIAIPIARYGNVATLPQGNGTINAGSVPLEIVVQIDHPQPIAEDSSLGCAD